jgi:DNA-binding transcriptional LysR family regulator
VIKHREVRALPLPGFAPVTMGLLWRADPSPMLRALIEEVQRYSRETWPTQFVEEDIP